RAVRAGRLKDALSAKRSRSDLSAERTWGGGAGEPGGSPGSQAHCPQSGPVEGVWGAAERPVREAVAKRPVRGADLGRGSGGTGRVPQHRRARVTSPPVGGVSKAISTSEVPMKRLALAALALLALAALAGIAGRPDSAGAADPAVDQRTITVTG